MDCAGPGTLRDPDEQLFVTVVLTRGPTKSLPVDGGVVPCPRHAGWASSASRARCHVVGNPFERQVRHCSSRSERPVGALVLELRLQAI